MKLIIHETVEYEIEPSYNGEPLAEMYQRFLDGPNLYSTAVTDRTFEVWGDGNPAQHRPLKPLEEIAFQRVEARS